MVLVGCTFSDRPTTGTPTWLKFWGALAHRLDEGVFGVLGPAFDDLLLHNAEQPERLVLRVVHLARDLGPLLERISVGQDPELPS